MEQLHTLLAAGIAVAAPKFKVTITTDGYQATDEQGHTWTATQLVEARLPATTVQSPASTLLSELAAEGIVAFRRTYSEYDDRYLEIDAVHTNRKHSKH